MLPSQLTNSASCWDRHSLRARGRLVLAAQVASIHVGVLRCRWPSLMQFVATVGAKALWAI